MALGSDIVKYVEVLDKGLDGSNVGTTDITAVESLILLVMVVLLDTGGGELLGVLVRLLKGEFSGLGLEVTSTRNKPLT